jgi:enoyl-CoA hydratase/carnithine racemase
MAYEFVEVQREGPVTTVILNRPEVMNALHAPAHFELAEVLDAFAADPEQWVAIVTGAGGAGRRAAPTAAGHRDQAGDGHDPDRPAGLGGRGA